MKRKVLILFYLCFVVTAFECSNSLFEPKGVQPVENTEYGTAIVNVDFPLKQEQMKIMSSKGRIKFVAVEENDAGDTVYYKVWTLPDTIPHEFSTGPVPAVGNTVFMLLVYDYDDSLTHFGVDTVYVKSGSTVKVNLTAYSCFGSISVGMNIPDEIKSNISRIEIILKADDVSPIIKDLKISGDSAYIKIEHISAGKDREVMVRVYNKDDGLLYLGKDTVELKSGTITEIELKLELSGAKVKLITKIDSEGEVHVNAAFPSQSGAVLEKPKMVLVPGGEFIMGSDSTTVSVDSFFIDSFEVTNGQFAEFLKEDTNYLEFYNDSMKIDTAGAISAKESYEEHPVTWVTWYAADEYCHWKGGILPSDTMWEKAARGTDGRTYPWDVGEPADTLLNFSNKYHGTTVVGSFKEGKSPYGCYDMAGNVYEWCRTKDHGGSSKYIRKGGGWNSSKNYVKSSYTSKVIRSTKEKALGFRCAKLVE